ncbi:MAG: hypothetical protein VKP70_08225 [Cyanobacteriota bacterium]|nr:hypothetical protein [Cyanobacteriota bacterium]
MALLPLLLGLTLLGGGEPFRSQGLLAMTSPWWEDYDVKERYLCTGKGGGVVLERNASQAALISGGSITTLFREASDGPALVYRNEELRLILRGDELTLERLPLTITCLRSEQA